MPRQSWHGSRPRAPSRVPVMRGQRHPHGVRPRHASGDRPPADGQGRGRRDARSRAGPHLCGVREWCNLRISDGRSGPFPKAAGLPGGAEDSQPRGRPPDPPPLRASGTRKGPARIEDVRVRGRDQVITILLALLAVLLVPTSALAYRPFVSTDAAVADSREFEIELGYFDLERTGRDNTITTPSVVLNYGFIKNWEVVGEFRIEASPELEIADPALSVKGVLKEGVLQEKEGVSLAIEASLLLPSTLPHEHGVGVQAVGIASGKVAPVTVHINVGGGLDRDDRHAFVLWGVIGELPVHPKLRLVGEINGQGTQGQGPNNSVLLGIIWQPTSKNVMLDAGVRHGISRAAPDWEFTLGLTYGFALPSLHPRSP